jgi:hypothetical protein
MWFVRRQSVHSGIAELLRELIYFFAVWAVGALIAHLLGVDVTTVAAWWGLVLATGCSLRINFAVRNIEAIIAAPPVDQFGRGQEQTTRPPPASFPGLCRILVDRVSLSRSVFMLKLCEFAYNE